MTSTTRLALVATALVALLGCRAPQPPPNVVLVVIDTLRADHVGAHGSDLGLTPELDRLARQGVVFDNAVATSSWTRSSVASMLTSRYAGTIGVLGREDAIPSTLTTLPEALAEAGYTTLAVSANVNAGEPFGFAQGFTRFETPDMTDGYPDDVLIHTAEGVTRKAIELVDDAAESAPLFLFVHYVDPHDPYLPHPGLLDEAEPAGRFDGSRRDLSAMDRLPTSDVTAEDIERIRFLYRGEVRYCDAWLGRLWSALEERGLGDDTLLVVTSDHGEGLWDHGVRGHGVDLYEEMIRVPLVVRLPAARLTPGPHRIDTPISLRDLAPTILEVAGVERPESFDGISLLPLLDQRARPRNSDFVFSELDLDRRSFAVVRKGELKLIENRHAAPGPDATRLFDLSVDPGERRGTEGRTPEEEEQLAATLRAWREDSAQRGSIRQRINADDLTGDTLAGLRALGYLGGAGEESSGGLESVIDFSQDGHAADQLLHGFFEAENGRRWMAAQSTVLLGRSPDHTDWQLEGWVDLDRLGVESLTLSISVDGGNTERRTLDRTGFFLLHDSLPPFVLPEARLHIACDRDFVPPARRGRADSRRLCAVIRSIALR